MSVTAETSQSARGPYVAIAEVAFALKARTATFRETVLVKVPGGDGGEGGSNGGEGGGGGCRGGGGGDGGAVGWNCTTKDLVPWLPSRKEKLCPKLGAAHSAPPQPSPHESVMSRAHVAPSATATLELYGAPPLSVVSSEQLRLQPTSFGYESLEQVIAERSGGAVGGDGGGGGDGGSGDGGGGEGEGGDGGGGDGGGGDRGGGGGDGGGGDGGEGGEGSGEGGAGGEGGGDGGWN